MIKKILSTMLVSSVLFVFGSTTSIAFDRPTLAIGLGGAIGGFTASGHELEGAGSPQEKNTREASGEFGWTNIFVEIQDIGDRLTLGASWSADDVDTNQEELHIYNSSQPAEFNFEVNAGEIQLSNIQIGDIVQFKNIDVEGISCDQR